MILYQIIDCSYGIIVRQVNCSLKGVIGGSQSVFTSRLNIIPQPSFLFYIRWKDILLSMQVHRSFVKYIYTQYS